MASMNECRAFLHAQPDFSALDPMGWVRTGQYPQAGHMVREFQHGSGQVETVVRDGPEGLVLLSFGPLGGVKAPWDPQSVYVAPENSDGDASGRFLSF